jgi:hypothetical protein
MQFQPIDLAELIAVPMGLLVVLIPVTGLTIRYALRPIVEIWAKARGPSNEARQELHALSARVAQLEQQLAAARLPAVTPVQAELPIPVEVRGVTRS